MKITKKEKYLLGILGAVLLSVLYYQFVYTPQINKYEELNISKNEKQQEYDDIMNTINKMDEQKGKAKGLTQIISEKSSMFYPEIIQEYIILEVDKLLADSGLLGTISFSEITSGQVEIVTDGVNSNITTSFDLIVDEYNSKFPEEVEVSEQENDSEESVTETIESQVETNQDLVSVNESTEETVENIDVDPDTNATAEQIKVSLNFSGSYTALKKFIKLANESARKIVITNISLSGKGEGEEVSGTMNLEFYGIPKLGNTDSAYYEWVLENTYGKDYPFSSGAANGSSIESLVNSTEVYDFIMVAKSVSSDLPAIMLGQSNDTTNASYLYSDSSEVENVEVIFTEKDGKFYYKYKVGATQYPLDYNADGIEFVPKSENIILNTLSTVRIGDEDKSGANIVIKNITSRVVEVIIEGEDTARPRISITSEGAEVKVTKK